MTQGLVVLSTLATSVMFALGVIEVAVNAALHRTVSGTPRPSFSGPGLATMLARLRDLFAPAVIAFLASLLGNFGTSVLLDDYRRGRPLWTSVGVWWLVAGLVVVAVAFVLVVAWPMRSAWELTKSYEALANHVRLVESASAAELDRVQARLAEADARAARDRSRVLANTLYTVGSGQVGLVPNWCSSKVTDPATGGITRPSWASTVQWAWSVRRMMTLAAAMTVLLALVSLAAAVGRGPAPFIITGVVPVVMSIVAGSLAATGIRAELSWQARVVAEDSIFAAEVRTWLNRVRTKLAEPAVPAAAAWAPRERSGVSLTVNGWTLQLDRAARPS